MLCKTLFYLVIFIQMPPGHLIKRPQAPSGPNWPFPSPDLSTLLCLCLSSQGMSPCSPATQPRSLQSPHPLPSSPGPDATNLLGRPHPPGQLQTMGTCHVISYFNTCPTGDSSPPASILLADRETSGSTVPSDVTPPPDPTLTCLIERSAPNSGVPHHLMF